MAFVSFLKHYKGRVFTRTILCSFEISVLIFKMLQCKVPIHFSCPTILIWLLIFLFIISEGISLPLPFKVPWVLWLSMEVVPRTGVTNICSNQSIRMLSIAVKSTTIRLLKHFYWRNRFYFSLFIKQDLNSWPMQLLVSVDQWVVYLPENFKDMTNK